MRQKCYKRLSAISPNFTIAAAFGNVHGVYKVRKKDFGWIPLSHWSPHTHTHTHNTHTHSLSPRPLNVPHADAAAFFCLRLVVW